MNIFGLKVVTPSGVTILDPDAYTVRLVETKVYQGATYFYNPDLPSSPRYTSVPMSANVKAGMFAVLSPLEEYDVNLDMITSHFGFGSIVNPIEMSLPTAEVADGEVILDGGPAKGYISRSVIIYVLAYN